MTKRGGDFLFELVEILQVGCQDKKSDVGPGEQGKGDQLRLGLASRVGDQLFELSERAGPFLRRSAPARRPGSILVEKMERAKTFPGAGAAGDARAEAGTGAGVDSFYYQSRPAR